MANTYNFYMTPGVQPFIPSKMTVDIDETTADLQLSISTLFELNLSENVTLTFLEPVIGVYIFKIRQIAGSNTVTWPESVNWPAATAPTLSTTLGKVDIITLVYDGYKYYGVSTLDF